MRITRHKILIVLAFLAIYVIWGSTYLLNKIAVSEIPPLMLSSFRFVTAGILVFVIARFMKLKLTITRKQVINCAIAGFLFLTYGNGVFVWALKYVDSGFAALEASLQPLFIIILMRILFGTKLHTRSVLGIALGFLGMYLLVSQEGIVMKENSFIGIGMILTCILSWSYASIFVSRADLPSNYFVSTAYQMVIGGILLALGSLLLGETWISPLNWSSKVQLSMLLLVIFGSIVAFTSFNYLLKNVSTEKVATSAYVNPVIALFLGWYILDEYLGWQSIVAAFIILTGVYFINSQNVGRTSGR